MNTDRNTAPLHFTGARPPAALLDRRQRPLRDLRLSVTDRCNFRCRYCMPREVFGADYPFLKRAELLDFEEIERLVRAFVPLGIEKLRITGGEPMVRKALPALIERLAAIEGIHDVTLTTNGSLLTPARAAELASAGLQRVTVSLDALDDAVFAKINDAGYTVKQVLQGIEAAQSAGLSPLKVNAVIMRGTNHEQVLPLAEHFRNSGVILRFIEYMDVGNSNGWRMEQVYEAHRIIEDINRVYPLEPLTPTYRGEVARRWKYRDGGGEIGVIASVTQPFCGSCTRARLSADGSLYTCLFASRGHDLRTLLRSGADDAELRAKLINIWQQRDDRYSEIRSSFTDTERAPPHVEMSYIGG